MNKLSNGIAAKQAGFTLIELVIVIVIIGILAAVAIPQFSSLSDDARQTHADAVAGAVAQQAGFQTIKCSQIACAPANGSRTCDFYTTQLPTVGTNGATLTCQFTTATRTTSSGCQITCTDANGTTSRPSNITFTP